MAHLTVAVLNYNGMTFLDRCLASIAAQTRQPDEVIVIDNGSTDFSYRLASKYGFVVRHASNEHQLITGLNVALSLAKEWLFFMQNDVILEPDCFEAFSKIPLYKVEIYQPVFYKEDREIDNSGMDWRWPGYGIGRTKKWWGKSTIADCGMVSTIAFFIHKWVIEKTGEYDSLFAPAYYEDIDWALRAKKYAIPLLLTTAKAIHLSNTSFSKVMTKKEMSKLCHKNRLKLINKHYRGLDRLSRVIAINIIDWINELRHRRRKKINTGLLVPYV